MGIQLFQSILSKPPGLVCSNHNKQAWTAHPTVTSSCRILLSHGLGVSLMADRLLVLQHLACEGPDLIADLALERGLEVEVFRTDRGDRLPDHTETPGSIALVLGGPMSTSDSLPWLQQELAWLRCRHEKQQPILGICLGAQLLAIAAGGSVEPLRVGDPPRPLKEVGYGAIHWLRNAEQEPVLRGMNPSETVLHWHGDRIRLPASATLLGSSLHCREQVFRIAQHAFALQCHLEVSGHSLERWIEEDRDYVIAAMGADGPQQLLQDWSQLHPQIEQQARRLFSNLLDQWSRPLQ